MASKNRILIVEDDESHAELILRSFSRDSEKFDVSHVFNIADARRYLAEKTPDIIITDWKLSDGEGISLIEKDGDIPKYPVVVMTSCGDESLAVGAIKAGAIDYVVKSVETMNDMRHIVELELKEWGHFISRKLDEKKIHEHQSKISSIFRAAPTGIAVVADRILLEVNDRVCEITGYSREELIGKSARILYPTQEEFDRVGRDHYKAIRDSGKCAMETVWKRKAGELMNIMLISTMITPGNLSDGLTFIVLDITKQKQEQKEKEELEEKLRHVQKMESVGRLAGGVAHDFNNLLTPILGYAELLISQTLPNDSRRESLLEIKRAAERARELTRQLLAFGRKQTLELKPVDLCGVVKNFEKLLKRTIRENITLECHGADSFFVKADVGQLEQVLMNLVVNAQDSMPDGGVISVHVSIPDDPANDMHDVQVEVSDNGSGMDSSTLEHLFEPFFTTKDQGKGTGLGLSTVYGIVNQHGGSIKVNSELGKGSSFKILLPLVEPPVEPVVPQSENTPKNLSFGGESILLVEDNEFVRQVASMMIEQLGYRVTVFSEPEKCVEEVAAKPDMRIDLLLTDVVMPILNGRQLYEKLSAIRPGLKVLYMSGYPSNVIIHQGGLEEGINFIQKPFTSNALGKKIYEAIFPQ